MAGFSFNGVDGIAASVEQLATLTDDDKWNILSAGAEIVRAAHFDKLVQLFNSKNIAPSIKVERKTGDDGSIARVLPTGKHPGSSTGKRKKKGKSSGSYQGTNAEVAYILEYGSPRISARHWMETANEECGEETLAAMTAAWDEHVSACGL